jgi:hypothetical protein
MIVHKPITECFLDGITDCKEGKTCEECRQNEAKWSDSWSQWSKSQSRKDWSDLSTLLEINS